MIKNGFYAVDKKDNTATALGDMETGTNMVFGACSMEIMVKEKIGCGYKIALQDIKEGGKIYKYGVCIGTAKSEIKRGTLVHSHNLASLYDLRSGSFDIKSGIPKDIEYGLK
ncbi:MAG: UxaA family hydrolase [Clostridiaceae bacterium]|nr:UxaA family hydrolase [Clostridiaceae bacterium]